MKQILRKTKLLERVQHHPYQKKLWDHQIIMKLSRMKSFREARTIFIYLPIRGEVDLGELFELNTRHKWRKQFVLSKTLPMENQLHLYAVKSFDDVEKGNFNILEPKTHLKTVEANSLDLALIPGVVFSRNGHRIGYGKGFIDRFFKNCPVFKIGIAYSFQIVENIEGESHDIPMDTIVTEKEMITIKKQ